MLYLCCTKLGITLVNTLFIGYCRAIYDKPMLGAVLFDFETYSIKFVD